MYKTHLGEHAWWEQFSIAKKEEQTITDGLVGYLVWIHFF